MLCSSLNGAPDLQVLASIAVLVLAGSLPGDHVSTERGEAHLENVVGWDSRDNVAGGRVDNGHPATKEIRLDMKRHRVDLSPHGRNLIHTFREKPMRSNDHMESRHCSAGYPLVSQSQTKVDKRGRHP